MNVVVSPLRVAQSVPPEVVRRQTIFEPNVPISKMFVAYRDLPDGGYARYLNEGRVAKIAANFDRRAVGIILLSMRDDGKFAIIDGHHRVDAAERNGIKALDAYVYLDLTLEQEADLYAKFGDYLKQTARDKYFAALAANDPEIVTIDKLLEDCGLRILNNSNSTSVKHTISAVDALLRVARTHGLRVLGEALTLLTDAFDGEPHGYIAPAIAGAGQFVVRFSGKYNAKRLARRLGGKGSPLEGSIAWEQRALHIVAAEHCDKGSAFGKAMVYIHDQGNVPDKIGPWPDRFTKPEHLEAKRERLVKNAKPASAAVRREAARQRSFAVACAECKAAIGKPCIGTQYVHTSRLRKAAYARQRSA